MRHRYLEVTFRRGKPLAAYLYLPRAADAKVASTQDAGRGLRIDYDSEGAALGIEVTAPSAVSIDDLNALLASLGQPELPAEEWAPASAA